MFNFLLLSNNSSLDKNIKYCRNDYQEANLRLINLQCSSFFVVFFYLSVNKILLLLRYNLCVGFSNINAERRTSSNPNPYVTYTYYTNIFNPIKVSLRSTESPINWNLNSLSYKKVSLPFAQKINIYFHKLKRKLPSVQLE